MFEIDTTDRRILTALQKTGRMSNAELSDKVNLSPSACHRRVQRLEAEGVIANYVALLDAFEREVALIPDLLECHLMAGSADYLLKLSARDTDDFARIHRRYLARLPGVTQMHSSFSLKTVCHTTALPV